MLTLFLRYRGLPTEEIVEAYIGAFGFLFALWLLVFYMAGLYSKHAVLFRSEVPRVIFRTQAFNIALAALLFFLIPQIGIAPKTSLAIYLGLSLFFIFLWRLWLFPKLSKPVSRERAAVIGSGPEVDELVREVNNNPRYHLEFVVVQNPAALMVEQFGIFAQELKDADVTLVVVDAEHETTRPLLPAVYELTIASDRFQYADFYKVYEEVFDRVPLSLLRYDWFLKNITRSQTNFYSITKRLIDIVGGLMMGLITIVLTPFIFLAMKLEGPGELFIAQERLGEGGRRMRAYKFRSMSFNNSASKDWVGEERVNKVTRVGGILRTISLDEFPQFLNILKGELSLIGPRNDILGLGERLAEEIPYYNVRYAVKPGISGWAQINQQYEQGKLSPQSVEETRVRLAYDFYYIKHRSFALDIVIALKTVKRMLFRVSSW
ncbi:MAG TPA: sugar transferase [Candidatus Paceibacterota bacterium]|nr:sugar transferase [Candidatus Paceibacterota bacterium]